MVPLKSRNSHNIRVINLSLGRPVYESYTLDPLCQAVESAWEAGIVVVVAAGNDGRDNSQGTNGYGTISAPGNDPYVITVGAMKTMGTPTRTDDLIASYSSKGPTVVDYVAKPDLVAPRLSSPCTPRGSPWPNRIPAMKFLIRCPKPRGTARVLPLTTGSAAPHGRPHGKRRRRAMLQQNLP